MPRLLLAATALLLVPTLAAAQPASSPPQPITYVEQPAGPDRSGVTFELNLGLGQTRFAPMEGDGVTRGGLSGLNLGLGGWIAPQTAITARVTGTSFDENGTQIVAGMLGVVLQQMVTEQAWVGGGVGIGVLTDDDDSTEPESGVAIDLRAGYNFYQSRRNAFHLGLEITPVFLDGGRVTAVGLQLGWQSL